MFFYINDMSFIGDSLITINEDILLHSMYSFCDYRAKWSLYLAKWENVRILILNINTHTQFGVYEVVLELHSFMFLNCNYCKNLSKIRCFLGIDTLSQKVPLWISPYSEWMHWRGTYSEWMHLRDIKSPIKGQLQIDIT